MAAVQILARAGHPRTLELLSMATRDSDTEVGGAAVTILGGLRDLGAAELLVQVMKEGTYSRSRVASQLDRFPLPLRALIEPLVREDDPKLRFWGATLLARYAGEPDLHPVLLDLAGDPDADVRAATVETLGKTGGRGAQAAAAVLLDDPAWWVRAHAARALGDLRGSPSRQTSQSC